MLPDAFPWWGLLALATAAFTDVVTDLLPAGLLPQMSSALHVPEARAGLLVSAFAVASALAAIPVTAVLRGLPRRPVLQWVLAGFALLDAVTAVSSWYPLTFLARLAAALTLIAVAMLILGLATRVPAALLAAAALWGAAFGGAPTLLQTALVDASGPASADVATALQTTVYNVGIAAGSLDGGLVLGGT